MNDFKKEVLKAYVKGIFSKHHECVRNPDRLQEICAEHGFDYIDHTNCDGFCPDCGQILTCEAYDEIKDEWDGYYV
ncbi:MAG: hypothetical protein C4538_03500 [Nitrospiraceae bacterium]|nr:MAG: hypothetical protein C4538_03500 [Nitrospiraceae bacterium]